MYEDFATEGGETELNAKIIVEFEVRNICDPSDLDESFTFPMMVRKLAKEEGLFGIVEDNGKILSVEQI